MSMEYDGYVKQSYSSESYRNNCTLHMRSLWQANTDHCIADLDVELVPGLRGGPMDPCKLFRHEKNTAAAHRDRYVDYPSNGGMHTYAQSSSELSPLALGTSAFLHQSYESQYQPVSASHGASNHEWRPQYDHTPVQRISRSSLNPSPRHPAPGSSPDGFPSMLPSPYQPHY